MKEFEIPNDIYGKGSECKVWVDGDYVYKAYREKVTLEELQKKLDILNTLPEYEYEEIVGVVKGTDRPVTKLRKLKDFEEIIGENFLATRRRYKDWQQIARKYFEDHGYVKEHNYYIRNNIKVNDIDFYNVAMTDDNEMKLIDAKLYDRI